MSFILDALRKSETDRQQKGTAEFANVPTSSERTGTPAWLWVLGLLLAVNLVVLVGLWLRPDSTTSQPVAVAAPPVSKEAADVPPSNDFAARVEEAKRNAPAREEPPQEAPASSAEAEPAPLPASLPATLPAPVRTAPPERAATLPTVHELRANGRLAIPDLHVDIHVYSEIPADRFVFINMTKHKEGSRLAEGPLVEEITADGVVMQHSGLTFFVPRD